MMFSANSPRSTPNEDIPLRAIATVDALKALLRARRVDISLWGTGSAKTVESLLEEIATGEIELKDKPFRRVLTGVVQVIIRRGDRILIEAEQVFYDGRRRARNIPPAEKMLPGESYIDAARRCLTEELGLTLDGVEILPETHTSSQEMRTSWSYPGLLGQYTIHRVEVSAPDLPDSSFWTEEVTLENDPTVRRHLWTWEHEDLVLQTG